jgi:hypothetical protein
LTTGYRSIIADRTSSLACAENHELVFGGDVVAGMIVAFIAPIHAAGRDNRIRSARLSGMNVRKRVLTRRVYFVAKDMNSGKP